MSSVPLFALYNGNPGEPRLIEEGMFIRSKKAGIKVGYEGDYIYDRDLKAQGSNRGPVDRFKYFINQGVFTINIKKRFEAYGSLGAMKARFHVRPSFDHRLREFQTHHDPTWGVGARGVLFRKRSTMIGLDTVFQTANLHVKSIAIDGAAASSHGKLRYTDWQVGLGIAHQVDILIPYLALTCSGARCKLSTIPSFLQLQKRNMELRNRHWVGMAVGCSLSTGKYFDVAIEAHLFDQQAFSVSAHVKF